MKMKRFISTSLALLGLLAPATARAAEDDPGGSSSDPGEKLEDRPVDWDKLPPDKRPKQWEVSGFTEVHRLIRQDDLGGAAKNKTLVYFGLEGQYDFTARDRAEVKWGLYNRFLSDPSETGVRSDDALLRYTRYVPLPAELDLRIRLSMTVPLSYESKLAGIITEPRLGLALDRRFGDFQIGVAARGGPYIVKQKTADGGSANPKATFRAGLNADYGIPFHKPLHFGASVETAYYWMYDVEKGVGQDATLDQFKDQQIKPVLDSQFPTPPVEQSYGGQIYAQYFLPEVFNLKTNLLLALAQGDPTLGYPNTVHDGRQNVYWFFRRNAQVYFAFTAAY